LLSSTLVNNCSKALLPLLLDNIRKWWRPPCRRTRRPLSFAFEI